VSERIRIAVTGLGIVCAIGEDQNEFWSNALGGRAGFTTVDLFDPSGCRTNVAAQVRDASMRAAEARRASRTDLLCMTAAREAVAQAGLASSASDSALARFGVSMGSSTAGMLEAESWCREGLARGFERQPLSPVLRLPSSVPADAVAHALGAAGPRLSNMTACASSALSIGHAADLIRSGEAPGMVAGGGDALCLMTYAGFGALRLLDRRACRPFDAGRHGLSLGEGAGVMVLERWDHAAARGAEPLAEFLDYGASCDAHHMTAPHPEGRGAAAAMAEALSRSAVGADRIGHVNAHGTGTTLNDAAEARALLEVFGAEGLGRIPITSTKSMTGHLLGGSGGLEAVTLVLSLVHQTVPPTLGWESPDAGLAALDIVAGGPRPVEFDYGMSNSFGFGGANCSLIFARVP
jgi:3-oxoacyl-[acyl-carrier-protein] synthase II